MVGAYFLPSAIRPTQGAPAAALPLAQARLVPQPARTAGGLPRAEQAQLQLHKRKQSASAAGAAAHASSRRDAPHASPTADVSAEADCQPLPPARLRRAASSASA